MCFSIAGAGLGLRQQPAWAAPSGRQSSRYYRRQNGAPWQYGTTVRLQALCHWHLSDSSAALRAKRCGCAGSDLKKGIFSTQNG